MDQRDGAPCERQVAAPRAGVVPAPDAGAGALAALVDLAVRLSGDYPQADRTAVVVGGAPGLALKAPGGASSPVRHSAHTPASSDLPDPRGGRGWMMWCRSCVSCVARASSSHTERRAGPVVRRRRTVSGRLPPTAASGTCAPRPTLTAILPRTDTGLLLLVMAGDGSSGVQLLLAASRGGGIHRREFEALSQDRRAPPLRHPKVTRTPLHTHTSARKSLLS